MSLRLGMRGDWAFKFPVEDERFSKSDDIIERAAGVLDGIANELENSHTIIGKWIINDVIDARANYEYRSLKVLANKVRDLVCNKKQKS